jgi:hypothetical protein
MLEFLLKIFKYSSILLSNMDNIQLKIQELKEQIEQLEIVRHKQEQEKIACALTNNTMPQIHLQNIRNDLFIRQFGYWRKVQDDHYNIEKNAWKTKYANANDDDFDKDYHSDYPNVILASIDNYPSLPNTLEQGGNTWIKHYRDNITGNKITYHFVSNKEQTARGGTGVVCAGQNHINPQPQHKFPLKDDTLAAILFLIEDLNNRVYKLEST